MLKVILFAGLGYILLKGVKTAKTLIEMEFTFQKLKIVSIKNFNLKLSIDILINNLTNNSVRLNEIQLDVIYKGNKIGRITRYNENYEIKPRAKTKISNIQFNANLTTGFRQLLDMLQTNNYSDIIITGYIQADALKFPVNETIKA